MRTEEQLEALSKAQAKTEAQMAQSQARIDAQLAQLIETVNNVSREVDKVNRTVENLAQVQQKTEQHLQACLTTRQKN